MSKCNDVAVSYFFQHLTTSMSISYFVHFGVKSIACYNVPEMSLEDPKDGNNIQPLQSTIEPYGIDAHVSILYSLLLDYTAF